MRTNVDRPLVLLVALMGLAFYNDILRIAS